MIKKIYSTLCKVRSSKILMQLIVLIAFTTWVHHLYGGLVYDTLYRIVVPSISVPFLLLVTFYLQYCLIKKVSRRLKLFYTLFVSLFWIVSIGFIEGGYNHIVKTILHLSGISKDRLSELFPPEFGELRLFEEPNDLFFELTGIIQFFIAVFIFIYLRKFLKSIS